MQERFRTGLVRLSVTLGVLGTGYGAFAWSWEAVVAFLHWVEGLSETNGLSGFVFLALSPFAFLATCFGLEWIRAGFAGRPPAYAVRPAIVSGPPDH